MKYLLALCLPPLAVLMCGKPGQAILNCFLCLMVFPGIIHAFMVVNGYENDQRTKLIVAAIQAQKTA